MKIINLTQNQRVIVDDDFKDESPSWYAWRANKNATYYAMRGKTNYDGTRTTESMHRLIMQVRNPSIKVDHVNLNGLDNRKDNLRISNSSGNTHHATKRRRKDATSKYKGVSKLKTCNRYVAQITHNYKNYYLGIFTIEEDAARAYDTKALELFGEFALTNKMLGLLP